MTDDSKKWQNRTPPRDRTALSSVIPVMLEELERYFNPESRDYIGHQDGFQALYAYLNPKNSTKIFDPAQFMSDKAYECLTGAARTAQETEKTYPQTLDELEQKLEQLSCDRAFEEHIGEYMERAGVGKAQDAPFIAEAAAARDALEYAASDIFEATRNALFRGQSRANSGRG